MIVAACVVLLIAAYLGFKLLKSLVKGFLLGLGLAAGVTLAWKIGLLPRETPTVVEKTGRKVEHKVQDMTKTVTRGAKEAAQEVKNAGKVMEKTTTRAVKRTVDGVEQSVDAAREGLEKLRAQKEASPGYDSERNSPDARSLGND